MSAFLFDALHQGLGKVLDLRGQQHGLTISNLANADTPGYRAREIDFDEALDSAMASGEGLALRRTRGEHIGSSGAEGQTPDVEQKEAPAWSEDGNSVHAETEISKLNANQLMYTAVANGVSRRLAILRYAASDGKV